MKSKRILLSIVLCALLMIPAAAYADGFGIYEWSASGVGMGEAYMFAEDDPAMLAYNPAQITKLKGDWFSIGGSYINPRSQQKFHDASGATSALWNGAEAPGYTPNIFYTHQQTKRLWWGIGVFTRFGASTKYEPNWPGRYQSYHNKISSLTFQPTIAYKASSKLSLAAGVDLMYAKVNLKNKIDSAGFGMPYGDLDMKFRGNNWSHGWLLSASYDFDDKNSFAMLFRSKVKHTVDTEVKLGNDLLSAYGINLNSPGSASLTLPESWTFGYGHKFNDRTRIELNAIYTKWSSYNKLDMIMGGTAGALLQGATGSDTISKAKDWSNVWRYAIGYEHKMNDKWTIMLGYAYDNTPIPDSTVDFMIPTGDRQTISIGFKRHFKNSDLSFAYGYMWIKDRVIPGAIYSDYTGGYADAYNNISHILAVSYICHLK